MAQDLYTSQGKPAMLGGELFDKFKSKRGASALEGFHGIQKEWLGQRMHSRKRGLALVADGTVRHNRKRRNQLASNPQQTPPVCAAGLLSKTDDRHRSFIEGGLHRLLSKCVTHAHSPVRDTDDARPYDLESLLGTNCPNDRRPAASKVEVELAPPAQKAGHEQSSGLTTELGVDEKQGDLQVPSAEANVTSNDMRTESGMLPAPAQGRLRQQKVAVDKAKKQRQDRQCGPSEHQPLPATSARSGCRTCRMTGTQCRLYKRIQWCASADPPFDDWITSTFPAKKAAAHERARRDSAGRGKPKGRPRKPKDV